MFKKLFKTENYIGKRKKGYFEGWYFRHSGDYPFSFIAAISRAENDEHSFIQYIDAHKSHYFRFGVEAFSFDDKDMTIRIGKNVFSLRGIKLDIDDGVFSVKADIDYSDMVRFKKTAYAPSIMGPFTYLPMVCNHCVISMSHEFSGTLCAGSDGQRNVSGKGYIEKDFGNAFPANYFWTHAESADTSIMFAVAWPLIFGIKGYLCIISHKGKQYNYSYYTRAKLKKIVVTDDHAELLVTKGKSALHITADSNDSRQKLIAPARGGKMDIVINENLTADITATLTLNGEVIPLTDLTSACFESVLVE